MKILSLQPVSLYENGGCGRLLRRIYEGKEEDVTGIYLSASTKQKKSGPIREVVVSPVLLQRRWMRWKLRTLFAYLKDVAFKEINVKQLRRAAATIPFDVLHVVNHGPYSTSLCTDLDFADKQLWVSFHDHFSLCSTYTDAELLWKHANRRFVISSELGEEYNKVFGNQNFQIITDGIKAEEISSPKFRVNNDDINIYFGGLLHFDYFPLFKVMGEVLDRLVDNNIKVKLIVRGIQDVDFLNNRKFAIEYRNLFVSDEEIKQEIDMADILYLPIKFTSPCFYKYSLSTKMIGYLGASGTILYHGPADSAANMLLTKYIAASSCTSLQADALINSLLNILDQKSEYSDNAKLLARKLFDLSTIQKQFWDCTPDEI